MKQTNLKCQIHSINTKANCDCSLLSKENKNKLLESSDLDPFEVINRQQEATGLHNCIAKPIYLIGRQVHSIIIIIIIVIKLNQCDVRGNTHGV